MILAEKNNKKVPVIVKDCLLVRVLTQEGAEHFFFLILFYFMACGTLNYIVAEWQTCKPNSITFTELNNR